MVEPKAELGGSRERHVNEGFPSGVFLVDSD